MYVRLIATAFLFLLRYTFVMKTVYVDEMFFLNITIDYFILLATAKLCALPLRRIRFGVSAFVGAAYSVLLLMDSFAFLASPVMKLVLGFIMTVIAFGVDIKIFKAFLAFLAVSAAFGGAVYAASILAGNNADDGLYIKASLKVLLLSFALCYAVLTLVFRRFGKKYKREIHEIKVKLCGKTTEFKALRDTGNALYDPISGLPVMIVGIDEAGKLLTEELNRALKIGVPEFIEALADDETLHSKFRLVPYSAVGLKMALLPVFRPDVLWVDGKEDKNVLVGLSPTKLSSDSEYSAVL